MSSEISTFELKTAVVPLWATANDIRSLFGVSATALNRLVGSGDVRKKKLGDADQAGAVYRVADMLDFLEGDEQRANSLERG